MQKKHKKKTEHSLMRKCITRLCVLYMCITSAMESCIDDLKNLEHEVILRCLCIGNLALLDWDQIKNIADLLDRRDDQPSETQKLLIELVVDHHKDGKEFDADKLARVFRIVKDYRSQNSHVKEFIRTFSDPCRQYECLEMLSFENKAYWFYLRILIDRTMDTTPSATELDEVTKAIDDTMCNYMMILQSVNSLSYDRPSNSYGGTDIKHTRPGLRIVFDLKQNEALTRVRNMLSNHFVLRGKADSVFLTAFAAYIVVDDNYNPATFPCNLIDNLHEYLQYALREDMPLGIDSCKNEKLILSSRFTTIWHDCPPHRILGINCKTLPDKINALKEKAFLHGTWWMNALADSNSCRLPGGHNAGTSSSSLQNGWHLFVNPLYKRASYASINLGLLKSETKMDDDAAIRENVNCNKMSEPTLSSMVGTYENNEISITKNYIASQQKLPHAYDEVDCGRLHTNDSESDTADKDCYHSVSHTSPGFMHVVHEVLSIASELKKLAESLEDEELIINGIRFDNINMYGTQDYELVEG